MHERLLQLWASAVLVGFAGGQVSKRTARSRRHASVVVVRGRLVAADTSQPFRDATVSLQPLSAQPPAPGREAMDWMSQATAVVDADGRFEFPNVRAGAYRIVATPAQTAMRYVQGFYPEASTDGPRSFRVSANQVPAEVVILLPRGAAITGRVVDEHGAPQSNVSVSVREALAGGRTRALTGQAPSPGGARTTTEASGSLVCRPGSTSWWRSRRLGPSVRYASFRDRSFTLRPTIPPPSPQSMPPGFAFGRAKTSGRLTSSSNDRAW